MWNTSSFEKKMLEILVKDFGEERGKQYYSKYTNARDCLLMDNFFSQINGSEPSLSDHGEKHIANVLTNAEKLLGKEIDSQSGITLYCLGLVILFHDVGNINGRESHNKNIADVYNHVRKKDKHYNHERTLVIKAGEAHCGKSKDGTNDTLKDLEENDSLDGEKLNLRSVAALLRLADELAEGPQRTSQFMIEHHKYAGSSSVFHDYASITEMYIDREGGRLSITYNIDIDKQTEKSWLDELLQFAYKRIVKVDEERRYNKHYCDLLAPFKKTTVQFNFYMEGNPINLDLGRIELHDRFPIPGSTQDGVKELMANNSKLNIDSIWTTISLTQKELAE